MGHRIGIMLGRKVNDDLKRRTKDVILGGLYNQAINYRIYLQIAQKDLVTD